VPELSEVSRGHSRMVFNDIECYLKGGYFHEVRLEAGDIGKVLSIPSASDNRRNGENAYSSI